MNITYFQHEK